MTGRSRTASGDPTQAVPQEEAGSTAIYRDSLSRPRTCQKFFPVCNCYFGFRFEVSRHILRLSQALFAFWDWDFGMGRKILRIIFSGKQEFSGQVFRAVVCLRLSQG